MYNPEVQKQITDDATSPLRRYQRTVVGSNKFGDTLRYELITVLFKSFPGALGLWLRSRFYRKLFGKMGRGIVIGERIIIHYPKKISLGHRVAMAYDCYLDARGDVNQGIDIGDDVIIGRNTSIVCKEGNISIGKNVGIGANSTLSAVSGNSIRVGDNVLIAPYVYIGGISYHFERTDIPIKMQGVDPKGGIRIDDNCWLGANVTIVDGVKIGHDAIVAAGAVVTQDVPPFAIMAGVPAKILRMRDSI
jgi:acetyltransferase-like isoleucine patch superfamily enzyme